MGVSHWFDSRGGGENKKKPGKQGVSWFPKATRGFPPLTFNWVPLFPKLTPEGARKGPKTFYRPGVNIVPRWGPTTGSVCPLRGAVTGPGRSIQEFERVVPTLPRVVLR